MQEQIRQNSNQYLTLTIAEERYAIPVTDIREVLTVPSITKIPKMPDFMRGVFNLRGSVVPILDLKRKFDLGDTEVTDETAVIVVELPYEEVPGQEELLHLGLFSDSVQKVVTIEPSEIEGAPKIGTKVNTSFILGMGHIGELFYMVLNISKILTSNDVNLVSRVQEEVK